MKFVQARFVGTTFDEKNIYEFLFSNVPDVVFNLGEKEYGWDNVPCSKYPQTVKQHIHKIGRLISDELDFKMIYDSNEFSLYDAKDKIIPIMWETENELSRLAFYFGDSFDEIHDQLFARDIQFTEIQEILSI
jgi:hypothetical protein